MPAFSRQLAAWYGDLGSMLGAGYPLPQALAEAHLAGRQKDIARMAAQLRAGTPWDTVVADAPRWLPTFDRLLLSFGQEAGKLTACCADLAHHHTTSARLRRDLGGALVYPLLVIHLLILTSPALSALNFSGDGGPIFATAAYLSQVLLGLALVWGPLLVLAGLERLRPEAFAGLVRWLPWLGAAHRHLNRALLAETFERFLAAGVPAAAAWFAAATATRDARLQKLALQHHDAMRQGQALGDLIEGCRELPLSFIRAYQTGERSGQLERVLPQQAQLAREAGQARLKQFAFWFPKLIFLLLAGVVAWSVVQGFQEILAPLHELLESEGL